MRKWTKFLIALGVTVGLATTVHAARTDMVDLSNYQGYVSTGQLVNWRNGYGVKAITTKVSEGTYYADPTAANHITAAQQAGLYINGYYFARYTSVASAQQEAQFAVQCARNAGLPTGSVLCADVEAPQQRNLGANYNAQCLAAAQQVVEQAGYRFDVYSMASWGDTVVPWRLIKWVAYYPYHVTTDRYTHGHAWQFTDHMNFGDGVGNVDCSQLYDNYYTAGQNKNAVISNADTAHIHTQAQTNGNSQPSGYAQNGWFYPNVTVSVRTAPSARGQILAYYRPGQVVHYDHVYFADGYAWAGYTSYSGARHYVALGHYPGASFGQRVTGSATRTVTVHAGDTLGALARRYGTSWQALAARNHLRNANLIYPGEVLYL